MGLRTPDVDRKAVGDLGHKGPRLTRSTFRFQLHPAIRKVADKAADLEFLGNLKGLVTEPNPLHVAAEECRQVKDFHGGCWT